MKIINVTKIIPQTMDSIVEFSDGTSGVASYRYNSLYNGCFPTPAHRLSKAQQRAFDRLDHKVGISSWTLGYNEGTIYPGHPDYDEQEYLRIKKEKEAFEISYDKNIRATFQVLNREFLKLGVPLLSTKPKRFRIKSPAPAFREAWDVGLDYSLPDGRKLERRYGGYCVSLGGTRRFTIGKDGRLHDYTK